MWKRIRQGREEKPVLRRGGVNATNLSWAKQIKGRVYGPEKQRDNELKRGGISLSKHPLNCQSNLITVDLRNCAPAYICLFTPHTECPLTVWNVLSTQIHVAYETTLVPQAIWLLVVVKWKELAYSPLFCWSSLMDVFWSPLTPCSKSLLLKPYSALRGAGYHADYIKQPMHFRKVWHAGF